MTPTTTANTTDTTTTTTTQFLNLPAKITQQHKCYALIKGQFC